MDRNPVLPTDESLLFYPPNPTTEFDADLVCTQRLSGKESLGIEFQFDQGQRTLKMEVTRLEAGKQVQWRVIQPVWPSEAAYQVITWTLTPYESSTVVDLRMEGWPQDDDVYASVSYKWASFMMRLKIYMGDTREIATFPPVEGRNITGNK
jgi:hypothetical protein